MADNLWESLFGWTIKKPKDEKPLESFTPEQKDDGAMVVASGGAYGTYIDLEGAAKSEAELVARYRDMANHMEVDSAVTDIVDEAIVMDEDYVVRINTDNLEDLSSGVKKKIETEFENVIDLLDFNAQAHEIFKRYYVDGRLYFHAIIDEKKPSEGIQELRYVDPRKIRKVREVEEVKKEGYTLQKTKQEYYVYNERGLTQRQQPSAYSPDNAMQGLKITLDSILHVTSGVTDENGQLVYSHLHKAIKPLNQLRTLEDAVVIYRISRAPERRIFYIDVGNLPKVKAEQYLRDVMVRHKNRLVYDANTGEVRDDRKVMTMLEDYWFARRDGGRGTEVSTLPAGQNLGELTDVEYFQKKLYKSLSVPVSRLEPELGMTLGRASEISRDEIKFSKFVKRLRGRFNQLFLKALEKQLVLKKIILPEEWAAISRKLKFEYTEDNHFAELKNLEIMTNRAAVMQAMEPYMGITHSWRWAREKIWMMTEEDMELEDKRIAEEKESEQFMSPELKNQMAMMELMPEEPEEEEEDPNIGSPDPDMAHMNGAEKEGPESLGRPTKTPPGKTSGPDKDKFTPKKSPQGANAVRGRQQQAKQGAQTQKKKVAAKAKKPQGK